MNETFCFVVEGWDESIRHSFRSLCTDTAIDHSGSVSASLFVKVRKMEETLDDVITAARYIRTNSEFVYGYVGCPKSFRVVNCSRDLSAILLLNGSRLTAQICHPI